MAAGANVFDSRSVVWGPQLYSRSQECGVCVNGLKEEGVASTRCLDASGRIVRGSEMSPSKATKR